MAKREKDKVYYEITKEKAYGHFQMMMVGGSAGAVLGFLVISLVGAYEGMEMDSLVLAFLLASFLGFFFGLLLTWLMITYVDKKLTGSVLVGGAPLEAAPAPEAEVPAPMEVPEAAAVSEEEKGKSVDFVFPELTPDNQ